MGAPVEGHRTYTRNRCNLVVKLAIGCTNTVGVLSLIRCRAREFKGQDVFRIETWIKAPKLKQTANHQSGTNQQHQSQRHLANNERRLHRPARTGYAATALA